MRVGATQLGCANGLATSCGDGARIVNDGDHASLPVFLKSSDPRAVSPGSTVTG